MTKIEAIKHLKEWVEVISIPSRKKAVGMAIEALEQEKRGKWIDRASELDAGFGRHDFVCSECARFADYFIGGSEDWWDTEKPNYCPHCGADMRGDGE